MVCGFFFIWYLYIYIIRSARGCPRRRPITFERGCGATRDDKLKNYVYGRLVSVRVKEHNIIYYILLLHEHADDSS